MNRNCGVENRIVREVTNQMVRSANDAARYPKINIRYKILVSRKLQYLAILWFLRCWISQILLHFCVIWVLNTRLYFFNDKVCPDLCT